MFKKVSVLSCLLFCGLAWGFPFEVKERINDVDILVETMDLGDNMGAVTLENYGTTDAQCTVRFRSGPGVPITRNARVEPGRKAHVTAGFNHQVIRMRVDVQCQPAQQKR